MGYRNLIILNKINSSLLMIAMTRKQLTTTTLYWEKDENKVSEFKNSILMN